MEKKDIYAALGLEMPGEKQEVAAPDGGAETKGEKEQEPAEPETVAEAEDGAGGGELPPKEPEQDEEDPEPEDGGQPHPVQKPGQMDKKERAQQAKARREREKQQAVEAARQEERKAADERLAEIFRQTGMTNRYRDNKPIATMEDYRQWQADADAAATSKRLASGTLTPEDLQRAVDNSPAMQQAQKIVEQSEALRRQQQQEQEQKIIQKELESIHKLDPSVSNLNDILALPTGEHFRALVEHNGMSFLDAFKLANYERLVQVQQKAATESAMRSRHSKDHLQGVTSGASEGVDVPAQTMKMYRLLRPDMTDEDIRSEYRKRHPHG